MEKNYLSVEFASTKKNYYFYCEDDSIKVGDKVIVETTIGKEIGLVTQTNVKIDEEKFTLEIKPIISRATELDLRIEQENKKLAALAAQAFNDGVLKLKLDMRLISTEYTFDRAKVLFIYSADDRVDFRELLKLLAPELKCRLELKQINPRERAQFVGGIGSCGLPLCCTTFSKTFENISLTRAKNQMLTINIPKLSGQCNKLMCCLKYEDDLYTEAKKEFPKIGTEIKYQGAKYTITGYNIISKTCKIENEDTINYVSLKDIKNGR